MRVGAGGVEPPSSSVSANGGEALCGSPFPQVAANRTCRSYAFSWRLVFSPSRSDDIWGRIRGSDDAGARLGTGSMLGRSLVGGGLGMQRRGARHQICRCLGDNCPYSAPYAPVGSRQLRLGRDSAHCGLVGCSRAWWNDRQNDHLSKQTVENPHHDRDQPLPGKRPPAAATRGRVTTPRAAWWPEPDRDADDAVERGRLASLLPRGQAAWVAGWRSEQGGTRTRSGNDLPASRWYSEDD